MTNQTTNLEPRTGVLVPSWVSWAGYIITALVAFAFAGAAG